MLIVFKIFRCLVKFFTFLFWNLSNIRLWFSVKTYLKFREDVPNLGTITPFFRIYPQLKNSPEDRG